MKLVGNIAALLVIAAASCVAAGQENPNNISSYFGFGDIEIIKLDWEVRNMRICDLNGDGRNDIIAANNKKSRIELLIQKEAIDSNEAWTAADIQDADINTLIDNEPTRFKNEPLAVSENIYSLACGDLNSDGLPDLAYYGDPKGLYVVLQKKPDANEAKPKKIAWETRKKIKIEDALPGPGGLVCADLTGDGKADIIVAAPDKVYLIEQKKDGSLAEPVKFPAMGQVIGVDVADVDGDGIGDLVILTTDSEKPLQIRFGLKTGQLGPLRQFFIERPWALKTFDVVGSTSSPQVGSTPLTTYGKSGEEILVVDAKSGRLVCYKFSKTAKRGADWPMYFYPLVSGESDNLRDIAAADFDGDGLTDVAISNPSAAEITLYKQQALYGLIEPVSFPTLADITSLSAADIDGDGKSELAVLSVKEKIIGISKFEDNRFSFPKPLDLTGAPVAMELADVDGDGKTDCLYISKNADNAMLMQVVYDVGQAGGRSVELNEIDKLEHAIEIKKLSSNPDGLKVVDVDQDGLNDVLIFVKYESPILLRQSQKRKFGVVDWPTAQASLIKEATLTSTAVCDVDRKEGKELLIAQRNFARSLVFSEGKNWIVLDQYNAKGTDNRIVAAAAFDIDQKAEDSTSSPREGRPEVLLLDGQKGQLQILRYGEDKTYRIDKEINVGRWESAEHLKMLNEPLTGGKEKSILLFDGKKFAVITPPSDSNGIEDLKPIFTYETKIKDGLYGNLTAGDINSDGIADIIMVEYKNNNIEILTFDDKGNPVSATKFRIFEEKSYTGQRGRAGVEPRELEVSDVTGDGKADLVTLIHDRIIIYPQD